MLMGEFEHALDSKGRLFVPAKMRESLVAGGQEELPPTRKPEK